MADIIKSLDCSFARGQWDSELFYKVRSAYAEAYGEWAQEDDCIANVIPDGCTSADGLGPRGGEFFVSLVTKAKVESPVVVSSRMSFEPEMAPLIVFNNNLAQRPDGEYEFDKHIEVVLYNEGINVWRHFGKNEDPRWVRAAYSYFTLQPNTIYDLQIEIKGSEMKVTVGDKVFGCYVPELSQPFHAGIMACEGLNRFYDFKIKSI